ncbi:MAG: hypothetical protein P4L43_02520 [Syntrophobacteraceae bacterium]|nr:hypothetical protein [Syntrophobacteraceae bacterium]
MKIGLLLILGCILFVFSKAQATITWSSDYFDYKTQDAGGIYYNPTPNGPPPAMLGAAAEKSSTSGNLENSDVATATESQPGLTMASGAWGKSFQNSDKDSGGATVNVYANNCFALDNPVGVCLNGQNVGSYINRPFTVSSTGYYILSASALAPLDWSGTTTGTAQAPTPQLTGMVQIFRTDTNQNTTTLLDSQTFSLSSLVASSQQVIVPLVAGDSYQFVVALSSVTNVGGVTNPAGIVTSFTNLDRTSFNSLGNIDGNFNVGTQTIPVTITASLSPGSPLWQNATDDGNDWLYLSWFGKFSANYCPWIYHETHGWLFPFGTSTDNVWFWDQTMQTFWWTSQTVYPFVYRASDQTWLFYDVGSSNPRWFYNYTLGVWEKD